MFWEYEWENVKCKMSRKKHEKESCQTFTKKTQHWITVCAFCTIPSQPCWFKHGLHSLSIRCVRIQHKVQYTSKLSRQHEYVIQRTKTLLVQYLSFTRDTFKTTCLRKTYLSQFPQTRESWDFIYGLVGNHPCTQKCVCVCVCACVRVLECVCVYKIS